MVGTRRPPEVARRGPGRPPLGDDAQSILASERRRAILDVIEAHPGIPVLELGAKVDLAGGVLDHHLDRLKRAGLVETRTSGHFLRLYPGGQAPPEGDLSLLPPSTKDVARLVLARPGRTSAQLAEESGLSRSRTKEHLHVLVENGLVEAEREGRLVRYHPTAELRHLGPTW